MIKVCWELENKGCEPPSTSGFPIFLTETRCRFLKCPKLECLHLQNEDEVLPPRVFGGLNEITDVKCSTQGKASAGYHALSVGSGVQQ